MVLDKDRAIVTQVAAKIAADLTLKEGDANAKIGEFALIFTSIKDILIAEIFGSASAAPVDVASIIQGHFPNATEVPTVDHSGQKFQPKVPAKK